LTDLERLIALEDIRLLRTRYSRLLDAHRWGELDDVLDPDATLDLSPAAETLRGSGSNHSKPIVGRDQIIEFMNERYSSRKQLLHIATIPEIYFDDDEHARGIWRQETFIKESTPDHSGCGIAYGTVYDQYVKRASKWWITSIRVTLDMLM
jgi:hypothetical protein